jgi:glutaredoxin
MKAQEMVEKSGQMGVPVVEIDSNIIIGFDKPEIDRLLGL